MTLRRAENIGLSFRPRWFSDKGSVTVFVDKKPHFLERQPTKEEWEAERLHQQTEPVLVMSSADRSLWQFQGRFYWDTERLDARAIHAQLVTRAQRDWQPVERAQRMATTGTVPRQSVPRRAIPDDVKQFVWQRDGGRCRVCGSPDELQFDVIPASMRGPTAAENFQLLCGPCNSLKRPG
jgi:hypothetical protein